MTSQHFANLVRQKCLTLCHKYRASHIGGAYSVADVLAVLYSDVLTYRADDPFWKERDRVFYSKGHACTSLYASLELAGFYSGLDQQFTVNGSIFTSHVSHKVPGVELSTGSLGHALSVSAGVALAAKRRGCQWKVFTVVSDGELDEGSNWETILFAPHHKLNNLCLIIDYNKIQSFGTVNEVLMLDPLRKKLEAFNWDVYEIDGHDHTQIREVLQKFKQTNDSRPTVIICNTIKGKGISFMENQLAWHYKSPNDDELARGLKELRDNA